MMFGFTVQNWKARVLGHPIEDSYAYDSEKDIIVVADGITRDPKGMKILPVRSLRHPFANFRFEWNYPGTRLKPWKRKLSPAKRTSQKAVDAAMFVLKDYEFRDDKAIRTALETANKPGRVLFQMNGRETDYLENDYYGCTAAIACLQDRVLSYGFIADSGVSVFKPDTDNIGNFPFSTPNQGPKKEMDEEVKMFHQTDFYHLDGRKIIRSKYRNNPQEPLSYGALTGEPNAEYFIQIGKVPFEITPEHTIAVYTDGLEHFVQSPQFAGLIKQTKSPLINPRTTIKALCQKRVGTEGTLVLAT